MSEKSDDFYVYVLFDWCGTPRYVGKGRKGRYRQHERDKRLKTFVAQTLLLLGSVPAVKVRDRLAEHQAYSIEQALIIALGREPNGPLVNRTDKGSGPNSEQVRKWHASRSPEERSASAKKSRATDRIRTTREERQDRAQANALQSGREALSERMALARAAQSEERRREIGRIAGLASSASTTAESKRERAAKGHASYMCNTTPEQRKENAKHTGLGQATEEQLTTWGAKGAARANASRTPEERSALARKAALAGAEKRAKQRSLDVGPLSPEYASVGNNDGRTASTLFD